MVRANANPYHTCAPLHFLELVLAARHLPARARLYAGAGRHVLHEHVVELQVPVRAPEPVHRADPLRDLPARAVAHSAESTRTT